MKISKNKVEKPSKKHVENCFDNSKNQCLRALRHFEERGSLTVFEGRELLGIMHLPARIMELRAQGWRIVTQWGTEIDNLGIKHRNGVYIFLGREQ